MEWITSVQTLWMPKPLITFMFKGLGMAFSRKYIPPFTKKNNPHSREKKTQKVNPRSMRNKLPKKSIPKPLNINVIRGLGIYKVCTEVIHSIYFHSTLNTNVITGHSAPSGVFQNDALCTRCFPKPSNMCVIVRACSYLINLKVWGGSEILWSLLRVNSSAAKDRKPRSAKAEARPAHRGRQTD